MKLRYFRTEALGRLQDGIGDNLQRYGTKSSWAGAWLGDGFDAESKVEVTLPPLLESARPADDLANVKILYPALKNLTPEQAMDGRFWAHLTHIEYWDYMWARWGIDDDDFVGIDSGDAGDKRKKLIQRIRTRYFLFSENSVSLVRSGIARLWWFGFLTYEENWSDPFALTETLLEYQDIQMALLERGFSKNKVVLRICLKVLAEYMQEIRSSGASQIIQGLGKYVNLLGGSYFLDTMNKSILEEKITSFVKSNLR